MNPQRQQEPPRPQKPQTSVVKRVLPYFSDHLGVLAFAVITLLVGTGVHLVRPLILREIIDKAIPMADIGHAVRAVLLFVVCLVVGGAAMYARVLLMARMGAEIIARIKRQTFAHIVHQGMRFFDQQAVGKLIARTESDADQLKVVFTGGAAQLLSSFVLLGGIVFMIFREEPLLGWWALGTILVVGTILFHYVSFIRGTYRQVRERNSEMAAYVTEYVQGVPLIKIHGREEAVVARLAELNRDKARFEQKAGFIEYILFQPSFRIVTEILVMIGIFIYASNRIFAGQMSVGTLVMFLEFGRQFFQPLGAMAELVSQIQSGLAAASRIFDILDNPSDIRDDGRSCPDLRLADRLEFSKVGFAYKAEPVLTDLSFTVRKGEHIAIVGVSGSGKTSCVSLLLRFYDPTQGALLIDGQDIRSYKLVDWRRTIALVLQEIYLFPGTVMQNLKAFDESIPDQAVIDAAGKIGAGDFISRLPNGFQTTLAERGANLSMGERQLLSYTRALVKNPDILLLDEATSAVDVITERALQKSMEQLMTGRTAIIIAHRLSTIRNADRILVLDKGRLVEEGIHEALMMANEGIYHKLVDIQSVSPGHDADGPGAVSQDGPVPGEEPAGETADEPAGAST